MKKFSIKLIRSPLGRMPRQRATARALGLYRLNSTIELPMNDAVRGMIAKIQHLLEVKEI